MKYTPTIGLEIHAELKTRTKMFCDSMNDPDEERPNVNVCPVCLGHPGTLPVVNKEAVKHVLKVGLAVGGRLADFTEFDRKNYFYPDIPKGYQISQYKFPLVSGGNLAGVKLTRIHLEEDTGTSLHEEGDYSLVNFNRAGVPLMELVTEPVIHSAKEAGDFARELQLLLRYLEVAEANMEKGEMRVEANISVSDDDKKFGTKVEVKNLNSFRAVERAINYEIERHTALLESGGSVVQETRGWDENSGKTFSQRRKEDSHDYRYFPDPDIPKLKISEVSELNVATLQKDMPELPGGRRSRYLADYGLKPEDVEFFVQNLEFGGFFEEVVSELKDKKLAVLTANYVISDLAGLLKTGDLNSASTLEREKVLHGNVGAHNFAKLISMVGSGKVSSRGAKDVLKTMFESGGSPEDIVIKRGLVQQSDEASLNEVVKKIIQANPKVVADCVSGKTAALQYLVGQGMKETKGAANPALLRKIIESSIKK